jgi:hypothetical protein
MTSEQLGDRAAIGTDSEPRHFVPLDLDQADPPAGQRTGCAAQDVDLGSFDVYLHASDVAVPDQ